MPLSDELRQLNGWCESRPGCIASWWREPLLSPALRARLTMSQHQPPAGRGRHRDYAELLHETGSCFDPHENRTRLKPAACPRDSQPPLELEARGEFGNVLLKGLPYLHWLHSCGLLNRTTACEGLEPFYTFSGSHTSVACTDDERFPDKFRWRGDERSLRAAYSTSYSVGIGAGRWVQGLYSDARAELSQVQELRGFPGPHWLPPPLHRAALREGAPLPPPHKSRRGRVFVSNSRDLKLGVELLGTILDGLLGCGFDVAYTGAAMRRDSTADVEMVERRFADALTSGRLRLLPRVASAQGMAPGSVSENELLLRTAARSTCFWTAGGGATSLALYQPGLHVVSDEHGRERCRASLCAEVERLPNKTAALRTLLRTDKCGPAFSKQLLFLPRRRDQAEAARPHPTGTYSHHFTRLPADAGESIIYNTGSDAARVRDALGLICGASSQAGEKANVCSFDAEYSAILNG